MEIRDAKREDARDLARLINLAGEGIPEYLWSQQAGDGDTALEVGARRAARDDGGFSYRHARVCVDDAGRVLGMLLAYRLPDPYPLGDLDDYPALVRPLLEQESRVPGSWYINGIATFEHCRGKGIGRLLIQDTERRAQAAGCDLISLIVASENSTAKRLYEAMGFNIKDSRPVVPYPGSPQDGDWILMVKTIGN
ncbi:GNAT family N-acetyltransferase [Marinobacterium aestuariivivens]|uniref:GNAT family N-acetyltransferase n=1 Tax=Marinobacterium aestuariivivens TaxID=1698799 RepID=A0ABW2A1R1_9GAMM